MVFCAAQQVSWLLYTGYRTHSAQPENAQSAQQWKIKLKEWKNPAEQVCNLGQDLDGFKVGQNFAASCPEKDPDNAAPWCRLRGAFWLLPGLTLPGPDGGPPENAAAFLPPWPARPRMYGAFRPRA